MGMDVHINATCNFLLKNWMELVIGLNCKKINRLRAKVENLFLRAKVRSGQYFKRAKCS